MTGTKGTVGNWHRATLLAAVALLMSLVATPIHAGDWKGKDEVVDGVRAMHNPAQAMNDPATVKLDELWRIGGETDAEEEFFGVILNIQNDSEGNIYLLDLQLAEVKVFSPDGKYLRTIGREGEGPGEFRFPLSMFFLPDGNLGVMQVFPGKIVKLTLEGEPAGEFPLPEVEGGGFRVLVGGEMNGGNLVLASGLNKLEEGKFETQRFLMQVDQEGHETTRYYEEVRRIEFANVVVDENEWDTYEQGRWAVGPDGRVYAAPKNGDYRIHVWKPDGTKDRVIVRDFPKMPRSQEDLDELKELYETRTRQQQLPNANIKLNDFHRGIERIYVRDDNSLWVLNSKGMREAPEDAIGTFDVFDPEGRFVQQVTLAGEGDPEEDGYFLVKDRVYVVTDLISAAMAAFGGGGVSEDEEEAPEPMQVICYRMDSKQVALN